MSETTPSYLRAMLGSQTNLYAGLGSLATAALLSIPFGFGIGAIPLIVFAAGELIAAMYVPALPTFRQQVDRRHRAATRDAARTSLLAEIEGRTKRRGAFPQNLQTYLRLAERVTSLYRHAEARPGQLSTSDVERLDDASIEYLCMWLALLTMDERASAINMYDIEERITALDREAKTPAPGTDLRQLQKARADYLAILERHRRMGSRKRALEAAMLSMPDQVEEIYQTIMTTPATEDGGIKLEDALAKLRLQEDIEAELAGDLAEAVPGIVSPLSQASPRPRRLTAVAGRQTN